jgi:hypothetical protein
MQKKYLVQLHQILNKSFDESELRTLCFYLGVDYDNLPDQGKENRARELITHLDRRNRVSELVQIIKQQRPDIVGQDNFEASPQDAFIPRKVTADVVIIDEDVSWTRVVAAAFTSIGLSTAETHPFGGAVALARQYQPGAIVVGRCDKDILSLLQQLRIACPASKIIGLLATEPASTQHTNAFDAILLKPVSMEEITKVLGLKGDKESL